MIMDHFNLDQTIKAPIILLATIVARPYQLKKPTISMNIALSIGVLIVDDNNILSRKGFLVVV